MMAVAMISAPVMPWPPGWMGTGAAAHTVTGLSANSVDWDEPRHQCPRWRRTHVWTCGCCADRLGQSWNVCNESMPPIREQDL